jgi:hypothetical protein
MDGTNNPFLISSSVLGLPRRVVVPLFSFLFLLPLRRAALEGQTGVDDEARTG